MRDWKFYDVSEPNFWVSGDGYSFDEIDITKTPLRTVVTNPGGDIIGTIWRDERGWRHAGMLAEARGFSTPGRAADDLITFLEEGKE